MRVWLGILILGVIVTAGVSVYLVQHPPDPGAEEATTEPAPPTDPTPGLAAPVDLAPSAPLATPTVEPGIVPDDEPPALPPPDAPLSAGDGATDAANDPATDAANAETQGGGTGDSGGTGGATDTQSTGGGAGNDGTGGDGGGTNDATPPAAPTPRTWTWTHTYAPPGSPDAFTVQAGIARLEFEVVFEAPSATLPVPSAVTATLVSPDGVAKIPCSGPALLAGKFVCGPFRTTASAGTWEVQYTGTSAVKATLRLAELP